eukprot:1963447-Pyramimonas_sp.AAC.1
MANPSPGKPGSYAPPTVSARARVRARVRVPAPWAAAGDARRRAPARRGKAHGPRYLVVWHG